MQTISETRRQRLSILIDKYGSIAGMNEAIGLTRTDATLSQIRNQSVHHTTKTPRTMGDALARKIEATLGLVEGWMDTPPSPAELHGEDSPKSQIYAIIESLDDTQLFIATKLLKALESSNSSTDNTKLVA